MRNLINPYVLTFFRPSIRQSIPPLVCSSIRSTISFLSVRSSFCQFTRCFIVLFSYPSVLPNAHLSIFSFLCASVRPSVRPFVRSSIRKSIRSSTRSFLRPSVHPFARVFAYPSVSSSVRCSLVRSSIRSFIRSSTRSFVRLSAHPFVRLSAHPFVRHFVRSFIEPSICSSVRYQKFLPWFNRRLAAYRLLACAA